MGRGGKGDNAHDDADAARRAGRKHRDPSIELTTGLRKVGRPETSGAEMIRQSDARDQPHLASLRDSGLVEKMLPLLEVVQRPGGWVAILDQKQIAPRAETALHVPGMMDLVELGVTQPFQDNRRDPLKRAVFPKPEQLIDTLERHGFTLTGQLAEHKNAILAAAPQKGGPGR